ncbi:MAG: hypothetical protein SFU99_02290 [Saprospiraceae bacterium]|nr:hypothetical protein [Saprospiraceae bacterium]
MKVFNLSIGTVIVRFYLMMLVVIIAGFIGQWWLASLALPIFLSVMFGLTFQMNRKEAQIKKLNTQVKETKKVG